MLRPALVMGVLHIPKREKELLSSWFSGKDEHADAVATALIDAKPMLGVEALAQSLDIDGHDDSGRTVEVLVAMTNMLNTFLSLSEQDEQQAEQMLEDAIFTADLEGEKRENFESRWHALRKSEAAVITAKAMSLVTEGPCNYLSARVVTELRPVFTEDPFSAENAVVTHQLKVVYYTSMYPRPDRRREVFLRLNREDLEQLQKVVKRALSKENALRRSEPKLHIL